MLCVCVCARAIHAHTWHRSVFIKVGKNNSAGNHSQVLSVQKGTVISSNLGVCSHRYCTMRRRDETLLIYPLENWPDMQQSLPQRASVAAESIPHETPEKENYHTCLCRMQSLEDLPYLVCLDLALHSLIV